MTTKGQLFVFEGVDAAGKSTISSCFCDWLITRGVDASIMSFPGNLPGTIGELVYRIHHGAEELGVRRITALSLQALHIAAHLDAIESAIIPGLEHGKTIILDRYWWSTRVYGVAGGANGEILDKLIEAELAAWGKWLPTALFCISRTEPLRIEPMEQWIQWKEGYQSLLRQEHGRYPLYSICNEKGIEDCLAEILNHCSSSA